MSVSEHIRRHLTECEFCAAEIELYSRHPQNNDPVGKAEIPPDLFELAEALLSHKHRDSRSLNKLLTESDKRKFVKI